jgi:hypothetical protein
VFLVIRSARGVKVGCVLSVWVRCLLMMKGCVDLSVLLEALVMLRVVDVNFVLHRVGV